MTTDLDRELRAIADSLVADAPEVPSIRARSDTVSTALPRRTTLAAAATVVVLGAAGLVVATRNGPEGATGSAPTTAIAGTPAPTAVSAPARYPVLDDLPAGAYAELVIGESPYDGTSPHAVALIGEVGDAGHIASTLSLRAGSAFDSGALGNAVGGVSVLGVAGTLYHNTEVGFGTHVAWGVPPYFALREGGPYVSVSAHTPSAALPDVPDFLAIAEDDFLTVELDDPDHVELSIGTLPDGYEVLLGPESLGGNFTRAELRFGSYWVETVPFNPLLYGTIKIERTAVGSTDAWAVASSQGPEWSQVVWQVDEHTWARAVGGTLDDTIALAESVRFVDRVEWESLYDPDTVAG